MPPLHRLAFVATLALATVNLVSAAPEPAALDAVTEARAKAEKANAPLLSPGVYQQAVTLLERARRAAEEGRKPERIQAGLDEAGRLFRLALDNTAVAAVTFADVLASREAAQSAEAWRLVPERWQEAERQFGAAARRLEKEDLQQANRQASEAAASYRDAELQAVRTRHLATVWKLMLEAEAERAERHAPRTWARAQARVAEAETALAAHRSQPGSAAEAIDAAGREARHALNIATLARSVEEGEHTLEDTLLGLEDVIVQMATAGGLGTGYVAGDAEAAAALVTGAAALRERADAQGRELAERDRQLAGLEEELREMDARLGGASAERDRLVMTLEAQRRRREQLATLETLFTPAEGTVIQQSDRVILRLTGLSFASGSARLDDPSRAVLRKVQRATALFPRAPIGVEGHTDSSGSDKANLRLSEERAQAVREVLAAELRLPAERIQSQGYGESRPIASNDSAAGRARNRRIDIVITPAPATP